MKITVDRNVVEFQPENDQETKDLEQLWRVIVDCARDNKKMVAIGEYIPQKKNLARFVIEGVPGGKTEPSPRIAEKDGTYYCPVCNKYINVKKGDPIPYCCGKVMEPVD